MKKFVLYERKSKDRKDKDGNIVANQHTFATQEWIVSNYLKALGEEGIDWIIVERYAETKSGAGHYSKRPLFSQAVDMCKKDKSLTLLCSKAERLARDMWSGAELMKTINFTLANAPEADDLQKHLEFMIAEREYSTISDRFKDMLAAKKARGEPVGAASPKYQRNPNNASKKNARAAVERTQGLVQTIKVIINTLAKVTLKNIAQALSDSCIPLPSGKEGTWSSIQVSRIINRFEISLCGG